jgi:hypothetical protein
MCVQVHPGSENYPARGGSKFYEIQSYIKYMRSNILCDMCICINFKSHVTPS